MNLTDFSVKNYQFTLVMFVMIAVLGTVTLLTMPRAEDPQINPPSYPVVIIYPGTSPKDMEELVVKPIENKLYELENIDKITTEIQDGVAIVKVDFKYGENVDNKYQELVREINALRNQLPTDIESIEIKKIDPTDVNILQLALVSENASFTLLKQYADDLKDALEKVPDLKKVSVSGLPAQEVRVNLQLDKMARLGIPVNIAIASLQSEQANIPGGSITAGTKTFNIKTAARPGSVADIANTVVYNFNGKIICLKDIATVGLVSEVQQHITRINRHRCVLVTAAQRKGANIAVTQRQFQPLLAAFEKTLPARIKLIKNFDQADNVALRLSGLGIDFLIAILLVLVTLLPLGSRASLIVMIAIPLSLALGLVGLNLFGYSLNQLSIVGLVVALGLLVDDSIVVVENIERWLRDGYSKKVAAVKATKQISLAVLGCTVTLAISFLPMIFLPGGPGEFVRGLPMAVICSVLASLIVSLTVVPFLAGSLLKAHTNPEGNFSLRLLKKIIRATYSKMMAACLKRPVLTLVCAFGLFAGSLVLFPLIGFKLFPTSEKPIFLINLRMPRQTSLEESDRITKMVEDSLKNYSEIRYFTANVGRGNPQIYYNVSQQEDRIDFSQIFVQLDAHARPVVKKRLMDQLRRRFGYFPYAILEVKDFEQGPPIEAPISIRVFGDNPDTLRKLSYQVEQIVKSNPGTIYTNNELNVLKTDIKIDVNREKARTLGVLTVDIARTVRMAVAGLQVGTFTDEKSDDYKVMVDLSKTRMPTLDVFNNLVVTNMKGTPVLFSQVANVAFGTSPTTVNHFNKNRFARITANTKKNALANAVLKEIIPKLNALKMPMGYHYALSGEAESEGDAFGGGFISVIVLTVFLFIAVLILQFKIFKGILIVLSVIPLGVVGGVTMLWLTGNPMSFIAIIGFIGLAGIEVKNSILLVDFTNQLRQQGEDLNRAIEQAGEIRFLPVVLTSLTAIGGLIPLALNTNPQISPLALVLIGGLVSSTLLSRIVTPVMYKLIPPAIEIQQEEK